MNQYFSQTLIGDQLLSCQLLKPLLESLAQHLNGESWYRFSDKFTNQVSFIEYCRFIPAYLVEPVFLQLMHYDHLSWQLHHYYLPRKPIARDDIQALLQSLNDEYRLSFGLVDIYVMTGEDHVTVQFIEDNSRRHLALWLLQFHQRHLGNFLKQRGVQQPLTVNIHTLSLTMPLCKIQSLANQHSDLEYFSPHLQQHSLCEKIYSLMAENLPMALGVEQLAQKLNMSVRTLKRRLAQCDTSYRQIWDQIRSSQAKKLLLTTELSMIQIAEQLGLSDPSNLHHCFKRWHQQRISDFLNSCNKIT
ncbi:helix-turn-helix transcriptional regulator [Paraferrimonas sp. SM1919]|uniref:AraC family transcriptional regulator n=1 Tax=Paraferrimonas sp. SM1919 TaxID=2662263 RepID=UPI0013D20034|nr:helix-turn-helix transcriptional regulator [Paraferrimonas sp. SM1919]